MKEIKIYCLEHFAGFVIVMCGLVLTTCSVVFCLTVAFHWSNQVVLGTFTVFMIASWTALAVAGGFLERIENKWWDKAQALKGIEK